MKNPKILPTTLAIILILLITTTYQVIFADKYYPGIYLGDTNLTFLTKDQALRVLGAKFNERAKNKLQFSSQSEEFTIDLATASATVNFDPALEEAFKIGHEGTFLQKVHDQLKALLLKITVSAEVDLSLDEQLNSITKKVNIEAINALLSFNENTATTSAQIQVVPSYAGTKLDEDKLKDIIKNYLLFGTLPGGLPIKQVEANVTTVEAQTAKGALEKTDQEPIKLSFNEQSWTLDTKTILPLIDLENAESNLLHQDKLTAYLKKEVAARIDQEVKEGQFNFDPITKRVGTFVPSQSGQKLDIDKTISLVNLSLSGARPKNITLPVSVVEPKIKTEAVNNLGIKELLGRGISNFAGSIPNRIYNIGLTATKINGVLIPPGEVFSFNSSVGDISAATGFKQAYVIKEGRTVLDDGGGVCQDSTTLFRAVLNAGLPVLKRTAHAYRVGYYEQGYPPGLDATVFYPSVDFQFKNDTAAHILLQAYISGHSLYIDLYGTPDGRISTLSKPVIASQTPPPPELRQDDPTLPKGTVKQVDFAAWGAQVSFTRKVTRNGEVLTSETWRSNYRPWQAIYLVGTKEN